MTLIGRWAMAGGLVAVTAAGLTGQSARVAAERDRFSVQVLPGYVAVTDNFGQKLYAYASDDPAKLTLAETIDLTEAGRPTIDRVRPIRPAATAPASTRPGEPETLSVYLGVAGRMRTGEFDVKDGDLPLFVREVAANRRVVLEPAGNLTLSDLLVARDKLRAAGLRDATFHAAVDAPNNDEQSVLVVMVGPDGPYGTNGFSVSDAELPQFVTQVVGRRKVVLRATGVSDVPLSRLVEVRDRFKAAGVQRVTFAGGNE